MEKKILDKSKPFVEVIEEDEHFITYGVNLPNDTIGDFAFDWDIDGSERAKWQEHLKELEEKGIRGDLVYNELTVQKNKEFDACTPFSETEYPLESYDFILLDVSKESGPKKTSPSRLPQNTGKKDGNGKR